MIDESIRWTRLQMTGFRSEWNARENGYDLYVELYGNEWHYIISRYGTEVHNDDYPYKLARQARKAAEEKFYALGLNIPF